MPLRFSVIAACGLALAACGGAKKDTGEAIDATTSGTGAGHLGAGPSERADEGVDAAERPAGKAVEP